MAQAAIHPSERVDDVSQSVSGVEYLEEEKEKEKEKGERERENFLNKMSRRRRERRRSSRTPSLHVKCLPSLFYPLSYATASGERREAESDSLSRNSHPITPIAAA